MISILAPRAGRDSCTAARTRPTRAYFNPRAPCGARHAGLQPQDQGGTISILAPRAGRDDRKQFITQKIAQFQSSRPVRGATEILHPQRRGREYFNPRAPCGARPAFDSLMPATSQISILAPRAGRDVECPWCGAKAADFNPRAPCGARRRAVAAGHPGGRFQSSRPVRGATFKRGCVII